MLTKFTQSNILKEVGHARLAKLLAEFDVQLKSSQIVLPQPDPLDANYFAALAAIFASPEALPPQLRETLLTLEEVASAKNAERLQASLKRRIPCVAVSETCALDRALDLFFLVPDELSQFQERGMTDVECRNPKEQQNGPLPMNLTSLCSSRDQRKALFLCKLAQQTRLGFEHFKFVGFQALLNVHGAVAEKAIEQLSEFTCQRDVSSQASNAAPQTTVTASEGLIDGLGESPGGATEHPSGSIPMGFDVSLALAALPASSRQSQPRDEMFLGRPARHIRPDFADQLHNQVGAQAWYLCGVSPATDSSQQLLHLLDRWRVLARVFGGCQFQPGTAWLVVGRSRSRQLMQELLQLPITIGDFLLEGLPQLECLTEGENVLVFPTSSQAFLYHPCLLLLNLWVTQSQQPRRIALPFNNCLHNLQPANTC